VIMDSWIPLDLNEKVRRGKALFFLKGTIRHYASSPLPPPRFPSAFSEDGISSDRRQSPVHTGNQLPSVDSIAAQPEYRDLGVRGDVTSRCRGCGNVRHGAG